jgi:hypothetical protein
VFYERGFTQYVSLCYKEDKRSLAINRFYVYPNEADFVAAASTCSINYEHMGGILASTILRAHFSHVLGRGHLEAAGTAYIAGYVEPSDSNDMPYDPQQLQAMSFMRGMNTGYDVMEITQPIVAPRDIITTLVNAASAEEGEHTVGLLSRPVLMDMGLRGLYLIGPEARGIVSQWASHIAPDVESGLLFKLGLGTVMHVADALHIQHNMQQVDHYFTSSTWTEELQGLSQLNTGE